MTYHDRNLRPENVMLDAMGQIRLVDHAFSKALIWPDSPPRQYDHQENISSTSIHSDSYESNIRAMKTFTLCGAPEYISPGRSQ